MQQTSTAAACHVVGREAELEIVERFVRARDGPATLLLTGEPGVGKTTLWEAGAEAASRRGLRVLSARPSDTESGLSFAALTDLLDRVDLAGLANVPAAQRHALETALLRVEPGDVAAQPFAVSAGLLSTLRALAGQAPIVVAVDDVPWLDRPSAGALVYATRRLRGHPVRFLLARRTGDATALEQVLEPGGIDRLEIGPLSVGAARRMLVERLGLSLPIRIVRQIHEAAEGKPLFLLELGRKLVGRDLPKIGEELPFPTRAEDLLGTRVEELSKPVRKLLLSLALDADLRMTQLAELTSSAALERACAAGVLVADEDRARPSHPLLASAVISKSRPSERRALHLELARVLTDRRLQARHLALAAEAPDPELAARLDTAATDAAQRGAAQEAVVLAEHALRLTSPDAPERTDRLLTLARSFLVAGDGRAKDLLLGEMDSLPLGEARVRACLLLARTGVAGYDGIQRYLQRALSECRGDPVLRARVLAEIATVTAVIRVERIAEAEAWALEALEAQPQAGPDAERAALEALAWARSLRGRQIDDVCDRHRAASEAVAHIVSSPERVVGQQLVWRGEVDRARALLSRLLSIAFERGEPYSYALQRLHVCELELRVGAWSAAERMLDEWAESFDEEVPFWPMYERCRALLAAGRGLPTEAERWGTNTVERAETTGVRWDRLEALRARGSAALLAGEPARAVEQLRAVWEHTRREGVDEPGVFPVAPELVEALAEVGELEEARAVATALRELSERQEHPWGLATAERCDALIRLAAGRDEHAVAALERAANDYGRLGLEFDRARTLLGLGRSQRRLKKWGKARRSLEEAAAGFDEIGSPGWAEQARSELARVSARRPRADGGLTPTEQRVARLAAEGLSNKEIAARLFVTVHTVEVHLSHVYGKLGVRSRGQLARQLGSRA